MGTLAARLGTIGIRRCNTAQAAEREPANHRDAGERDKELKRRSESSDTRYVDIVLIVIAAGLVLGPASMMLRSRARSDARRHSSRTSTGGRLNSTALEPAMEAELVLAHGDVVVLPPVAGASCATVLGDADTLDTLERAGLIVRRDQRRPFQQLVETYTGLQTKAKRGRLRQMADKPVEGAYLKLTDESRRQLDAGQPVLARTGDLLGVVNDDHGRRRHMLRFENAITMANPEFALAAATLQAVLAIQEQLEAIEERLVEIQQTLGTLVRELDFGRLAEIAGATELLAEVADDIRRRGFMDDADWQQVVETRLTIKTHLIAARFNLTDLTSGFSPARSRRDRIEALDDVLKGTRLEYWMTMFVDAQLANVRADTLKLLHEASSYPDHLGDLERRTRDSIDARRQELTSAGLLLRDIANPAARRWTDHLQQISRYKLSQKQPMVEALLAKHGDVFAPPAQISASDEPDAAGAAFAVPGDRPTVLAGLDDA